MIEKAKTMQETMEVENVDLQKKVVEYDKVLAEIELEAELRKQAFEIQKKNPVAINPNYEFEKTDEWRAHLVEQWQFDLNKNLRQISFYKEEVERKKQVVIDAIAEKEVKADE
jgi:hypothetical protein